MRQLSFVLYIFLLAGIITSCKKNPVTKNSGEAEWIKVITDSAIYFPGKIRSDKHNNLYCSYNYRDYKVDSNSAIIKLDTSGNVMWRVLFTNLTVYDFAIMNETIIIASHAEDKLTLTTLSSESGGELKTLVSMPLPLDPTSLIAIVGMKLLITIPDSNYNISGTLLYKSGGERYSMGFMAEIGASGNDILGGVRSYDFQGGVFTTVTGCAQTDDGYLLFGNIQHTEPDPIISKYFILKTNLVGDYLWTKTVQTSFYDPNTGYTGYYCNTSDIISAGNGIFYACAFNEKYNLPNIPNPPVYSPDDNSARIFKITSDSLITEAKLKYEFQNFVADLVVTNDGGLLIALNPFKLQGFYYVGKQNGFIAQLGPDLAIQSVSKIQNHYFDCFGSICKMPDGHYAFQTMIQSLGSKVYRLEIIKTDEYGNF